MSHGRKCLLSALLMVACTVVFRSLAPSFPHAPGVTAVTSAGTPRDVERTSPAGATASDSSGAAAVRELDPEAEVLHTAAQAQRAFDDWLSAWRRAEAGTQPALVGSGVERAAARRQALKALMLVAPQRAFDAAIAEGLRRELPVEVQALLERRIDGRGDLEATVSCEGPRMLLRREAVVGGERFAAHVFGRREAQATKFDLPLHGIAIDDVLVLDAAPFRELEPEEKATLSLPAEAVAVQVGSEVKTLRDRAELRRLAETLEAAEAGVGPRVGASGPIDTDETIPSVAANTPWVLGKKRVLWVQVDFSDDQGGVATEAEIKASSAQAADFFAANSQGKTTLEFTVLPSVLRLSARKTTYNIANAPAQLQAAAAIAAKAYDAANGGTGAYDPSLYDRWIVLFRSMSAYEFGGQAQITGPEVRMNGTISPGTLIHELGHTQGLRHSHYWRPSSSTGSGEGTHVEYGDVFDVMGASSGVPDNPLNVAQKMKLGYLDTAATTAVTESGTHRIARHDHTAAGGVRSLKITAGGIDYWAEYRRVAPASVSAPQLDRLRNGVLLHWGDERRPLFVSGAGTYLVDATASSAGGASDAAVRIGEKFVDPDAGLTLKPVAVGGTAPNEYIEVQVGYGAVDGNRNPVLEATASATLPPRTNLVFTASATDPDGDPVYYRWDFGDRQVSPAVASVTRRFLTGGPQTIQVSAHDGKGGIARRTLSFDVVDPLRSWTRAANGVVATALNDVFFDGSRFVAAGDNGVVLVSVNGFDWTRYLAPPTYHLRSLASNGARLVAGALRTATGVDRGAAIYSDDGGANWGTATLPAGTGQILGVAHGAGRFVAVGEGGRIYHSLDGAAWSETASGVTQTLRHVVFLEDVFVATGDGGRVLVSTDGLAWSNRSLPTTIGASAVVRHNNLWLVATGATIFYTSPDLVQWTRKIAAGAGTLYPIARLRKFGGLLFTANENGSVAFAEDIPEWAAHRLDTTAGAIMQGVAAGNGVVVAVGNRGQIYTAAFASPASGLLAAPTLRHDGETLRLAAGKKNLLAAGGAGFTRLELYVNGTKVHEIAGASGALEWTPPAPGSYSLVIRGIDAQGAAVVASAVQATAGFPTWNWRNPSPVGASLEGVVRAGDKWWVAGRAGALLTVDTKGAITPVELPTTQHFSDIAYANGRYVVAAPYRDAAAKIDIGPLWTSTDGYAWTPLLTTPLDNFNATFVHHGGGKWLVGTTGGLLLTSENGLDWTRQNSGTTRVLRNASYGNNLWVVAGTGGLILTSPDAVTWTQRTSGTTTDFWHVGHHAGIFVAVGLDGTIVRSADGVTWTRQDSGTTQHLIGIASWNDAFVVTGNGGVVLTSTDGRNWSPVPLDGKRSDLFGISGQGNDGLMVGRDGELYLTNSGHAGWRRLTQGTGDWRRGVIYAGGRFVAVGWTTDIITDAAVVPIVTSVDGITWTRAAANSSFVSLHAVTHGQQLYVAVGEAGRIFSSNNATNWGQQASPTAQPLYAVAAGGGTFVAAGGGGALVSSSNGLSWTMRSSGTTRTLRGAAYGAGRFVVVGDQGTVLFSTNGTSWNLAASGTLSALNTVGWWEQYGFIAAGENGTMISSADGNSWQLVESGFSGNVTALASTPLGLIAAGGEDGGMIVSPDGASWSIATLPNDNVVRGLAASASAIVAVGDSGSTLTYELAGAPPAPAIAAQPASQTARAGAVVSLSVGAQNVSGAVYQWRKDGVPIVGANAPTHLLTAMSPGDAGSYTVVITGPGGSAVSAPAVVALDAVPQRGRLINLSVLTHLASAGDNFIFGMVLGGEGTAGGKALLVRAAGPALGAVGVASPLEDPKLEFFTGQAKVGQNDDWGGGEGVRDAFARVGAFPFAPATSRDAAIAFPSLASGTNSVKISGSGAGTVLAELYDATPPAAFSPATPRLVNVSVLKHLGDGITAGFVVSGTAPCPVLIRAVGPTLGAAPFGVPGVVADPRLTLFNGQEIVASNDDWGGTAALSAAFTSVGAFGLAPGSKDAALLAVLPPGSYTVSVAGVGGSGTALIEIYEVP